MAGKAKGAENRAPMKELDDHLVDQMKEAVDSGSEHKLREAFKNLPKDALQQAVEHLKKSGNDHYLKEQYKEAIDQYSLALIGDRLDPKIYCNRSLVFLKMQKYTEAIADAEACIALDKDWAKGYYRKGRVLLAQQKAAEAKPYFKKCIELEPSNRDAKLAFSEAEKMAAMMDQFISAANQEPGRPPAPLQPELDETGQIKADKPKFWVNMAEKSYHPENQWYKHSIVAKGMQRYLETQCNLFSPKAQLAALDEYTNQMLIAGKVMQEYIKATSSAKVVVVGSGAGVLPLMASEARASVAYSVEHYHYESQISRSVVARNKYTQMRAEFGARLQELTQEQLKSKVAGFASDIRHVNRDPRQLEYTDIPEKCNILVVNRPHYSLLGTGLMNIVQNAQRTFLTDDAKIVPCKVKVYAAGLQLNTTCPYLMRSFVETYSWSLNVQPIDLRTTPHKLLTKPFQIFEFVMNDRKSLEPVERRQFTVPVETTGILHGFVYYYETFLSETLSISNCALSRGGEQALYYINARPVQMDTELQVLVSHNKSRITFDTAHSPSISVMHEFCCPEWMRNMVNDTTRTEAYSQAIEHYCHTRSGEEVTVLSLCGSPGVIAMVAAQQMNVRKVYVTEKVQHLAANMREVVADNGLSEKITVINKEPRNLEFGWEEYQHQHYDLHERPDCIIFELFDCACVGEGVLYYSKFIRNAVNTPRKTPTLIPCGATIKGCLVQLRSTKIHGYDVGPSLNIYRWQPDMGVVDLKSTNFKQLSDEFEIFRYDFYQDGPDNLPHAEIAVPIIAEGIVSAIVVWFDLQMDAETTYSTSPFQDCNPHIKQGITYINELKVSPGARVPLIAVNKGADIVFSIDENALRGSPFVTILPLPRLDPAWREHAQKTEELTKSLQSRMQVASEFKAITQAALKMAIQPTNFGLDPQIATKFCNAFFTSVQ